jgi:hypothetical protein
VRVTDDDHHADPVRTQQIPPEVMAEVEAVEAVEASGEHERPCEAHLRVANLHHPQVGRLPDRPDPVNRSRDLRRPWRPGQPVCGAVAAPAASSTGTLAALAASPSAAFSTTGAHLLRCRWPRPRPDPAMVDSRLLFAGDVESCQFCPGGLTHV